MSDTSFKEQVKVFHGASPELYDFLLDLIQDAQSLGSIVQIVTIIPPFLELSENGEKRFKTYSGGCSPNSPRPGGEASQYGPDTPQPAVRVTPESANCSPNTAQPMRSRAGGAESANCSPNTAQPMRSRAGSAESANCSPNSPKKD